MALTKCKECGSEVSSKAEACPKCGVKFRKKTSCLTLILAPIIIFVAIEVVTTIVSPKGSHGTDGLPREKSSREIKEEIRDQIKLDWAWQKAGFGNIMEAEFTITNSSPHDIKDVEIRTIQSGKSGTQIDRNTRTIYEIIKAGETKEFKKFNMGFIHSQSESAGATIIDFSII